MCSKSQLAELRAEYGVLARTEEILKGKDESFQQQLVSLQISVNRRLSQRSVYSIVWAFNIEPFFHPES